MSHLETILHNNHAQPESHDIRKLRTDAQIIANHQHDEQIDDIELIISAEGSLTESVEAINDTAEAIRALSELSDQESAEGVESIALNINKAISEIYAAKRKMFFLCTAVTGEIS